MTRQKGPSRAVAHLHAKHKTLRELAERRVIERDHYRNLYEDLKARLTEHMEKETRSHEELRVLLTESWWTKTKAYFLK